MEWIFEYIGQSGFSLLTWENSIMILIGVFFCALAIQKDYEPVLLLPLGFGMVVGSLPTGLGLQIGVYDSNSLLSYIYLGVSHGILPPIVFLGIGAMIDFSVLLANPKLILLGAAAQVGIFLSLMGALWLGFSPSEAGALSILGAADGPTALFLTTKIAPHLIVPIAVAVYVCMALVPLIQPPIMYALTSKSERKIRMNHPREVSKREKIIFPIVSFIICSLLAPGSIVLLGMFFFGNVLKESCLTQKKANFARSALIDFIGIFLGFIVGCSTQSQNFLNAQSLYILALGLVTFSFATLFGILFAKFMNLFLKEKINPLIGAAGVSAFPDSARLVQHIGRKEDPNNFLLMHALGPNVAGVLGSALAAGVLWSVLAN